MIGGKNMDKDYILKVKGLYHQFLLGNNKTLQVLKNVSLSASRGEFISILELVVLESQLY